MKKLILTTATVFGLSGAVYAADFGGEVSLDIERNSAGDFIATPGVDLSFGITGDAATVFGGVDVTAENGDMVLDGWNIGTSFGETSVSFGDQGDLFSFGGLEAVGGDTLADVADDHESLIVKQGNFGALVGFTDITNDASEVENLQLSYAGTINTVKYNATVDYNLTTEDYVVGGAFTTEMGKAKLGLAATYGDLFAYEATVGFDAVTVFANGDEVDAMQNIGAGVSYDINGAALYAEVGYNLDTEELTPAIGVGLSF
jgi:hypothetical protein